MPDSPVPAGRLQRTQGVGRIGFGWDGARTVLKTLHQAGAAKIRLPALHDSRMAEAVLINTAGGLTDGDSLTTTVQTAAGADAVIASQACEKIYRALGPAPARVESTLRVAAGARLAWLPQETILFDGARLDRRLTVELEGDADFVGVESLIFGRESMGEAMATGAVRESWRVRRDGRLLFADGFALEGDIAGLLARPALAAGNRYLSTVLCCREGVETLLDPVRAALAGAGAASAFGGKLVARIACRNGRQMRAALGGALAVLRGGEPLPRVWSI